MAKTTFKLLNEKGAPTTELLQLIDDKSITNRYASLKDYFKGENIEFNPKELAILIKRVDNSIYKQVSHYAHLMYHSMEQNNEWGDPGEQQVKIAFCRNLLQIDSNRQLTQADAVEFMNQVETNLEEKGIKSLSAAEAKAQMKTYVFTLLGKRYEAYKAHQMSSLMRFIGSNRHLHGGQYGLDQEFILGEGPMTHDTGYDIIKLEKELVRTPNNVMSMAAIIGNRNIYLRIESLKTIFAQKWLQMFHYSDYEVNHIKSNAYWNIGEGIKQKVLELYDIHSEEDLKEKEETFINDMAETILKHELGHGIVQHNLLPFDLGAIGEASKIYGENIYTAFLEFLADFAPKSEGILGPIFNMIEISKKDKTRAERMYYMYLSDTWFFNTEDTYMYTYSDLMALILIRYITPDQSIDFGKLERDLQFRDDRGQQDKLTLFERIYELYTWDTQEIKNVVEHAEFTLLEEQLDYKKIRSLLVEQFRQNDGYVHEDTYEFLVPYWTNMLGYIKQISNSAQKLEEFINNQQRKNLMKMLVLSCGRATAEKFQFKHRDYIVQHLTNLNLVKY